MAATLPPVVGTTPYRSGLHPLPGSIPSKGEASIQVTRAHIPATPPFPYPATKWLAKPYRVGFVNDCQGDREGRPIRINLRTSPSTSVGARAADGGLGGPLWSPASCSSGFHVGGTRVLPNPTLAPTDRSAS